MLVRMTRTVRVADRVEPFEIGVAYDLPDALAESWIAYGVADRQEEPVPSDPDDPGPIPAERVESPDAAVHDGVTEADG